MESLSPENERIKIIRKDLKLTQNEFAESLSVTQTTISQLERGRNGPSMDLIKSILNKWPVSPDWLILGLGEKYRKNHDNMATANTSTLSPKLSPKLSPISKGALLGDSVSIVSSPIAEFKKSTRVPILDQRAYAGSPGGFADYQGEDVQYITLPNLPAARTLIGIEVYGESMSPTILEGDILVCAQILKPLELKHLGIYVVCMLHDGASVKRYYGPEEDYLLFKSDNPQHSSLKVIPDESIQLWEVLYRVTGSFPQRTELSPDWMHQVDSNIAELKRSLKALQTPKK